MSNEDIIANLTKKLELAEADKAELISALNSTLVIMSMSNVQISRNPAKSLFLKVRKTLEKYGHE